MTRWILVAALAVVFCSSPIPALAARIESVGAVLLPAQANERQKEVARGEAFQRAIWEAVLRVAERLVEKDRAAAAARSSVETSTDPAAGEVGAEVVEAEPQGGSRADLRRALGDRPRGYTSRYRLLKDRGVRPRMFVAAGEGPGDTEYVVVAEVGVDEARVRAALEAAGIIAPPVLEATEEDIDQVRVVLWDLPGYSAYQAVKAALAEGLEPGAVVPIEFEPGRAVLGVRADLAPQQLARAVIRALPEDLRVAGAVVEGNEVGLRIERVPPVFREESLPAKGSRGEDGEPG